MLSLSNFDSSQRIHSPFYCYLTQMGFFCTLGDEQEERSFRGYKRRNDVGGSGFNSGDDVYQFNATRTIFVGNIERNTTSTELKKMFERYGEIVVSITLHTVRSLFICD